MTSRKKRIRRGMNALKLKRGQTPRMKTWKSLAAVFLLLEGQPHWIPTNTNGNLRVLRNRVRNLMAESNGTHYFKRIYTRAR